MRILPIVSCAALLVASRLSAQSPTMSAEELHDRIVAVMARNTSRSVPQGDTFVSWSPRPVLYSTVRRHAGGVESSLIRADGMVGTAEASWTGGRPTLVRIRWTEPGKELLQVDARVEGEQLVISGGRDTTLAVPTLPWAIADYGMEDQLLPLIDAIAGGTDAQTIAVYRPYPNSWDSLSVRVEDRAGGRRVTLVDKEGERWTWMISAAGALVQMTRSKHADFERKPLPTSARVADYMRLREGAP